MTIERNTDQETKQKQEFLALQNEIYDEFSHVPLEPVISVKAITQTNVLIGWECLELHTADLRGIDVYRNNQKLSLSVPLNAISVKLSGTATVLMT
jgi:hypothetical protein